MFSFDLPFLFICGLTFGNLTKRYIISQKINLILALFVLFIFQTGGLLLWMNIFLGTKEFMIIPFQIIGMNTQDFEPFLVAILFGLEPLLIMVGEMIGLKDFSKNTSM